MMIDAVLDMVVSAMAEAGIKAFREFPARAARRGESVVSVGTRKVKCLSSGLGDYLGVRTEDSGEVLELYGKRLELELVIEVFSSFDGADGPGECVRCADSLRLLTATFPAGIKLLEFCSGEVAADEELRAFRCECTALCLAFFVAEDGGGEGEFLDFVLKGVVDGVN